MEKKEQSRRIVRVQGRGGGRVAMMKGSSRWMCKGRRWRRGNRLKDGLENEQKQMRKSSNIKKQFEVHVERRKGKDKEQAK